MSFFLFLSALLVSSCLSQEDSCCDLNKEFEDFHIDLLQTSLVRFVSLHENATDSPLCLCRDNPCASPRYALYGDPEDIFPVNNITVILGSGVHRLDEGLTLINSSFISFVGVEGTVLECGLNPIFDNCSLGNVFISYSSFVSFSDITFQNCHLSVPMVHVKKSDHVIFNRCTFLNNPTSAVHLQQVDSVAIRECTFMNNIHRDVSTNNDLASLCYFQQRLSESFFFNTGPTAGAVSVYADDRSFKLLISSSIFDHNSASDNHNNTDLPKALLQHGHGGALFIRLVNTSNAEVCIENSNFTSNTAQVNGGAIQLSTAQYSNENAFNIIGCNFIANNCTLDSCIGGAIGVDLLQDSVSNSFVIIRSLFQDNRADAGGGVVLLTSVTSSSREFGNQLIIFRDCDFLHNLAKQDGSALSIFSVTPISSLPLPITIQDCSFRNNTSLNTNQKTAAVSGFSIALNFFGSNVFHNNFGGGLSVIESQINAHDQLVFHHNFATSGGAMALYGRCLLKLHEGSNLTFYENFALRNGGGLYVEYVRTDFIFGILNRGCFVQYDSSMDLPPHDWNTTVNFIMNTAGEAGAAIYASDMSYCRWYGDDVSTNTPIFIPYKDVKSPFHFRDNKIGLSVSGDISSVALSTDAFQMTVVTEEDYDSYSYNERVLFRLSAVDRFNNSREAVWQVDAPLENEPLGAISSNRTQYTYNIPSRNDLLDSNDNLTDVSLTFSIFSVSTSITPVEKNLSVETCHPGYAFNNVTTVCQCESNRRQIVRCDGANRYFYVQEGLWVYANGEDLVFRATIPGFLNCTQEGNLPGCLFKFDRPNEQCTEGRTGVLCAQCADGYNLALDLLSCSRNCSDVGAAFLFAVVCILTVVATFLALYFDVAIPNELKGFIFFAQVIGVIYRNSPYLNRNQGTEDQFLDFIINMFGLSLPFPVCFSGFSSAGITWLGVVPPTLALATAIIYIKSTDKVKFLYERKSYGFHGFHFISLFIYKYFLDTSFAFANIRRVYNNDYVFSYTGEPFTSPLILAMYIIGIISILLFAAIIPIIFLIYIYRPQKHLHLANAFTFGVKNERIYLWHGVWDIWRRLPFVAINLFISLSSVSIIVLLHCLMVLIVLTVHCIFKPYKKDYINVIEVVVLFCLLGATLAILDENDIYIGKTTSVFFIIIPFVYALIFIIYYISVKIYKRKKPDFSLRSTLRSKLQPLLHYFKMVNPENDKQNGMKSNNAVPSINNTETFEASGSVPLREPLLEL